MPKVITGASTTRKAVIATFWVDLGIFLALVYDVYLTRKLAAGK